MIFMVAFVVVVWKKLFYEKYFYEKYFYEKYFLLRLVWYLYMFCKTVVKIEVE
jgi:hypothetical protein